MVNNMKYQPVWGSLRLAPTMEAFCSCVAKGNKPSVAPAIDNIDKRGLSIKVNCENNSYTTLQL